MPVLSSYSLLKQEVQWWCSVMVLLKRNRLVSWTTHWLSILTVHLPVFLSACVSDAVQSFSMTILSRCPWSGCTLLERPRLSTSKVKVMRAVLMTTHHSRLPVDRTMSASNYEIQLTVNFQLPKSSTNVCLPEKLAVLEWRKTRLNFSKFVEALRAFFFYFTCFVLAGIRRFANFKLKFSMSSSSAISEIVRKDTLLNCSVMAIVHYR